jgi:hypothetical protein
MPVPARPSRSVPALAAALTCLALGSLAALPALTAPGARGATARDAAPAQASPTPPAGDPGAAPGAKPLTVLGHSDLGGYGRNAGAWAHKGYAYVGATCTVTNPGKTTKVVDVRDPANPRLLPGLPWPAGSRAAEVKVQTVESAHFSGDLMAVTLEQCTAQGPMGIVLWDVTDPADPERLALYETNTGVHTLWVTQQGERILVLLALPGAERRQLESGGSVGGPEFRIVDVTNPRAPVLAGTWSMYEKLGIHPRDGYGSGPSTNLHEVAASPDGRIAYLAWWDAGMLLMDISDPANPTLLSRTNYASQEGNTHTGVSDETGRLLLVADEDFDPTATRLDVLAPPEGAGQVVEAQGGAFNAELMIANGPVTGELVYVGRGCPGRSLNPPGPDDPYEADPAGKVALMERGPCANADKVLRAQKAGALGVLMINDTPWAPPGLSIQAPMTDPVRIPSMLLSKAKGEAFRSTLAGGTAMTVRLSGYGDQWGSAWLMDIADPRNVKVLSQITTTHTMRYPPYNRGTYTAHQPLMAKGVAWLAWYGDGLRAFDVRDPAQPKEVGYFMPPQRPGATGTTPAPFSWGIGLEDGAAYISDSATGLWILGTDVLEPEDPDEGGPLYLPRLLMLWPAPSEASTRSSQLMRVDTRLVHPHELTWQRARAARDRG